MAKKLGVPYVAGSSTSKAAAHSVVSKAGNLRKLVWETLEKLGAQGATTEELCDKLDLSGSTIRPRLVELRDLGRARKTGVTRVVRSGRQAGVCVAIGVASWVDKRPGWPSPQTPKGWGEMARLRKELDRANCDAATWEKRARYWRERHKVLKELDNV
jgi:hypothetical protein